MQGASKGSFSISGHLILSPERLAYPEGFLPAVISASRTVAMLEKEDGNRLFNDLRENQPTELHRQAIKNKELDQKISLSPYWLFTRWHRIDEKAPLNFLSCS